MALNNAPASAGAFDIGAYLDRIGLTAPPPPSVEGLKAVHRAHRLAIPFENLDIRLGRGISLDPDAVFAKLVTARRGGYCFEQNQLFGSALAALGFETRPLLARVWLMSQGVVPPTTHRLELVRIEGEDWIADAGFGGAFTPPMRLAIHQTGPETDGTSHRLRTDPDHGWMLERHSTAAPMDHRLEPGDWQAQYSFTLRDVHANDLEQCNHWTSTRPGTRFTSLTIASRIMPDGFIALTDGSLSISTSTNNSREDHETPAAIRAVLAEYFGIDLPETELARLPQFGG